MSGFFSGLTASALGAKNILGRQPPDDGVQFLDHCISWATLLAAQDHIGHPADVLSLPPADRVRMELVLCRNFVPKVGIELVRHSYAILFLKILR